MKHYKQKIMNSIEQIIAYFIINFNCYFNRQLTDLQKRRFELLNDIKRKDRRTKHFVKDKQEAVNLV
jgi:hypothetical protein